MTEPPRVSLMGTVVVIVITTTTLDFIVIITNVLVDFEVVVTIVLKGYRTPRLGMIVILVTCRGLRKIDVGLGNSRTTINVTSMKSRFQT